MGAKSKVNATGRGGTQPFLLIRRSLLHSPQFSALSPTARSLFQELHGMFNGANNGSLFLSVKDAADRLGVADLKAVSAAFNDLIALRFISETIGAVFKPATNVSKARAWRLNWIVRGTCAGPECLPPLDFAKLTKRQKRRVEKRSGVLARYVKDYCGGKFPVEDSPTLDPRRDFLGRFLVEDSSALNSGNGENLPKSSMADSSIHIEYHGGVGTATSAPSCRCHLHFDGLATGGGR